ncbi:MAG: hypothetical protein II956_15760 [Bacteroidales bacterium]|nr:hypothetical protein [Bacteroidales bacterium]
MTEQEYKDLKKVFDKVKSPVEKKMKIQGEEITIKTTTLDPIRIAMAAPRRTGKTSLLATIFRYMKEHITPNTFEIVINEDDDNKVQEYANTLQVIKNAKTDDDVTKKINNLEASNGIQSFKFTIRFKQTNDAKKTIFWIELPFEIMDVAGGIVENDKNQDANKREEFKAHLDESSILIVPFDSILLMEKPITNDREKLDDFVSRRLSINNIEDWCIEWAKTRKNDRHPKVIFVAMKSETYHTNKTTADKSSRCFEEFNSKYRDTLFKLKEHAPTDLKITYTPLETLGCVKCNKSLFDDETEQMVYSFIKVDSIQNYLGAGIILGEIFERAKMQIKDTYGDAQTWIKAIKDMSWFEKIKHLLDTISAYWNEDGILDFFNGIQYIEQEIDSIAAKDKCKYARTI